MASKIEKRLKKSIKKLEKSQRRLKIAKFRRIKAEEGRILAALFGKPKK